MRETKGERAAAEVVGKLSLTTKGILVVGIPVCALVAAITVFYLFEQEERQAASLVENSYKVRSEIRRVQVRMVNAETGARGYLLTRQPGFLEPYLDAERTVPESLASLRQLVRNNPVELQEVNRVNDLASRNLALLESFRRKAAGQDGGVSPAELAQGKGSMDELRSQVAALETTAEKLVADRTMALERAQRRLEAAIFGGGIAGLIGGLLGVVLFTTRIAGRVHRLEEDAERVAKGLPIEGEVRGGDEIARLHRTLQNTSRLLTAQGEELRAAHDQLEARVQQRTAELLSANEKLREATELSNALIRSSPLGIWAIDLEGNVKFWNPAAESMFGWTESEVIDKPLPVLLQDQQDEYAQWLERFRRGEFLSGVERKRRKKDGSEIDVVIWTAPLRDAAGNIRGTIAIDSDLTERKVLEEQFRQSQKLEALGRLAGGVAHDFNNLLTVISGYTEMIVGEAEDRPALLDYAGEIQYAANRAGALTAQLLAFSRRQITQPKVLDLNEIVTHSTKLLRRVIGEDIEIETHLDPKLGKVKADPIHVDQIIMNLVVNARDAMGGGGKLTIETRATQLDADYVGRHIGVEPGHYSMLAISDTGIGMDAATRSRLFEPFFTTKEPGKGTGLGLSIVYGIVKQNSGEIMVYSEPGRGTTFKIYLPVAEMPAEFSAAEAWPAEMRGTETVLLCEDEDSIRRLVHAMLAKQGYTVIEAETPEDALAAARNGVDRIDLLLTDMVMPRMSGFELAKAIQEARPNLKVLYMSGYTDSHVNRGATMLEPNTPFIQKPFTAATLTQKVREVLNGSATAK